MDTEKINQTNNIDTDPVVEEKRKAFLKEIRKKMVAAAAPITDITEIPDCEALNAMMGELFSLPATEDKETFARPARDQVHRIAKKCASAGPSAYEAYAWRQSATELYLDLTKKWMGAGTDAEREILARIYIPILDAKMQSEGSREEE